RSDGTGMTPGAPNPGAPARRVNTIDEELPRRLMKTALKVVGVLLGLVILVPLLAGLVMKGLAADEPPPGQLVDVGGHKLHIYCTGTDRGLPPVLIEAGLGLNSAYYHWIQTKLARSTKVC